MTIVDGFTFPNVATWITDVDRLNTIGEGLLAVSAASLGVYGRADFYERQVVGHADVAVEPSRAGQLTVTNGAVFIGRAGEEQFQFLKGEIGRAGFSTATYTIEISRPYVVRPAKQATPTTVIDGARRELWRDAYIVWRGLVAVVLGGVTPIPWLYSPGDLKVGSMIPQPIKGQSASWAFQVQVALN